MLFLLVLLIIIASFMTLNKKFTKNFGNFIFIILYVITVFVIAGRYGNSDYFGYID